MPVSCFRYAYSVGRIRALEAKLIDKQRLRRMVESDDIDSILRILFESGYSETTQDIRGISDIERFLECEMIRTYKILGELAIEREIYEILTLRYDFHNLKVILKSKYAGEDSDKNIIRVGTLDVMRVKKSILEGNYLDINKRFRLPVIVAMEEYERTGDVQVIDIVLDSEMFKEILRVCNKLSEPFLKKLMNITVDLNNTKIFFRVIRLKVGKEFLKRVLIAGGLLKRDLFLECYDDSVDRIVSRLSYTDYSKLMVEGAEEFKKEGNLNFLERLCDDFIMEYIRKAKFIAFGPQPLIAYILAKENELKVLKIVMVGKISGWGDAQINSRLREVYA